MTCGTFEVQHGNLDTFAPDVRGRETFNTYEAACVCAQKWKEIYDEVDLIQFKGISGTVVRSYRKDGPSISASNA